MNLFLSLQCIFDLISTNWYGNTSLSLHILYFLVPERLPQGNFSASDLSPLVTSDPRKEEWLKMEYWSYTGTPSLSAFYSSSWSHTILISLGYYRMIHLVFKIRWVGRRGRTHDDLKKNKNQCLVWIQVWLGPLESTKEYFCVCLCVWMFDPRACLFLRLQADIAKLSLSSQTSPMSNYSTRIKVIQQCRPVTLALD